MKRSTRLAAAILMAAAPVVGHAEDIQTVATGKSVSETVDALTTAVEGAGATVFSVIDHGKGARTIDMDIGSSVLVVFGNPGIGTPAIADNRLAGLHLPLKVLVYEDRNGAVHLAYEDPAETLDDLDGIDDDAEYIAKMRAALATLTAKAAC